MRRICRMLRLGSTRRSIKASYKILLIFHLLNQMCQMFPVHSKLPGVGGVSSTRWGPGFKLFVLRQENNICTKGCVNTWADSFILPVSRVEVCYQRMENPGCHVVDASPSREKVLQMVLSVIQNNCNYLQLLRARRHILLNLMLFDPSKPTTGCAVFPDFSCIKRVVCQKSGHFSFI